MTITKEKENDSGRTQDPRNDVRHTSVSARGCNNSPVDTSKALILANLTRHDFKHFKHGKVKYSGAAADPAFTRSSTRRYGKHAPYIATFPHELWKAVEAIGWKKFTVHEEGGQWIVSRIV